MATVHTDATTVVLADDDPRVRSALQDLLEDADGMEVAAAVGTAADAIRACAEHEPEVAVLDVRMPGDGLAAAREITTAGTASRVVVLTAIDEPEVRAEALANGAAFFVLKSDGADLLAAIRGEARRP